MCTCLWAILIYTAFVPNLDLCILCLVMSHSDTHIVDHTFTLASTQYIVPVDDSIISIKFGDGIPSLNCSFICYSAFHAWALRGLVTLTCWPWTDNLQLTCHYPISKWSVMGRKGTPFPHLQFMTHNVTTPQECYNAGERHTTIVRGPNLNVAFPQF